MLDNCKAEFDKVKAMDSSSSAIGDEENSGTSSDLEFIIDYAGYEGEEKEMN